MAPCQRITIPREILRFTEVARIHTSRPPPCTIAPTSSSNRGLWVENGLGNHMEALSEAPPSHGGWVATRFSSRTHPLAYILIRPFCCSSQVVDACHPSRLHKFILIPTSTPLAWVLHALFGFTTSPIWAAEGDQATREASLDKTRLTPRAAPNGN